MQIRLQALTLAFVIGMCGCASYEDGPFVHKSEDELDLMEIRDAAAAKYFAEGDFEVSRRICASLASEATVSRPVYRLEQASSLLLQDRKAEAHEMLTSVRSDIELLFDKESEEKALSVWHGENNKVFKGDNHERGILYAFLAMGFLEKGELEDAARCVKNGLLADSSTDPDDSYSSDFGLLHYLGYVIACRSGDEEGAREYRRELLAGVRARHGDAEASGSTWTALLDVKNLPNAFLVIWSGTPPSFVRAGEYEEIRQIIPGHDRFSMLTVDGDSCKVNAARMLGDVNYQAMTRGGREMETVLSNKAMIKSGMAASGNFFLVAGVACFAAMAGQSDSATLIALGSAGATCLVLGGAFHLAGAVMNPTADARYWKNLPGNLTIVPLCLPAGDHTLTVRGYAGWDNVLCEQCHMQVPATGVVFRHLSLMPQSTSAFSPTDDYDGAGFLQGRSEALMDENWMKYEVTQ